MKLDKVKNELSKTTRTWFVTGVAGFIGSNLLEELLNLGQNVIGLDNFETGYQKNLDEVQALVGEKAWSRFTFLEGDIRNLEDCRKGCAEVDYVLHQAALGSVPRSVEDPVTTNECNVDGFLHMLVAARDAGVKRFVFASSSAVYGDNPSLPKVEDSIGTPLSPYGLTKHVNELYAKIFISTYQLECIGLRYFNVFGGRQDPNGAYAAVIPRWIGELTNGTTPIINGDGETSRDFCYIDNVVQANILAAATDNPNAVNQVYNVACGRATSLNELFKIIRDNMVQFRPDVAKIQPKYGDARPGDIRHSLAEISKVKQLLEYSSTYDVFQGMNECVKWHVNKP